LAGASRKVVLHDDLPRGCDFEGQNGLAERAGKKERVFFNDFFWMDVF
jgi:hypothetical protein